MIETVRMFEHLRDHVLTVSSCMLGGSRPELPEEFLKRVIPARLRYCKQDKSVSIRMSFQKAK
jgi:hypothetical protein